jgi:hypothetical protein
MLVLLVIGGLLVVGGSLWAFSQGDGPVEVQPPPVELVGVSPDSATSFYRVLHEGQACLAAVTHDSTGSSTALACPSAPAK